MSGGGTLTTAGGLIRAEINTGNSKKFFIHFYEILSTFLEESFLEESQSLGVSFKDQYIINWSLDVYEDLPREAELVQWAFEVFEIHYGIHNFKIWIYDRVDEMCNYITTYTGEAVDSMDGVVYEDYCQTLFLTAGLKVSHTMLSGDQGVDLISEIEDFKVCIQCKRYSKPIGNKAVQEVLAGKVFYGGTHAVVISNAGFTKAEKSLAKSADVILISDTELEDLETMV